MASVPVHYAQHVRELIGRPCGLDRQAPPPAPLAAVPRPGDLAAVQGGVGGGGGGGGGAGGGGGGGGGSGGGAASLAPGLGSPKAPAPAPSSSKGNAEELFANANKDAAKELNALASLIRPAAPVDTFKLNLFNDGGGGSMSSAGAGGSAAAEKTSTSAVRQDAIQFDGDAGNKASGLADIMSGFGIAEGGTGAGAAAAAGGGAAADEQDDLLALMDGA